MFKVLYSHVNNIIDKYLQIYNHILIIFTMSKKKREKIKTKATIKRFIHNDLKKGKIKTNAIYTNL